MKRRTFLRSALAAGAAAPLVLDGIRVQAKNPLKFLAQLPTAQDDDKILIICQLFGGNDGINMLPPADDPQYLVLRPNIAVPKAKCWTNSSIPGVYFHPSLAAGDKGGLTTMLQQGNLAVVRNVGYPNPNLSHFRSTDIWLSGINDSNPNDRLDTGWVGRYLQQKYPNFPTDLPSDPLAIQFGGFSLALESKVGRMGIEVSDPSKQQGVVSASDALDDQSANTAYFDEYQFVADIAARSDKYAQRVKDSYATGKALLKGKYRSGDAFATQMANCAALIAGGLQTKVYVVSMGGFDTHVSQTLQGDGSIGEHATLLSSLADGIAQFMNDMIRLNLADRIVGLTISEFGRRPEENGSFGTDHGAASVQFVFGTQVNSGIYGAPFDLSNFDENKNLGYSRDFRTVYLDVLTAWFGMTLDDARLNLKGGRSDQGDVDFLSPAGTIRAQTSGVSQPSMNEPVFSISSNYPNPFTSSTTVVLELPKAGTVSIEVTDIAGRKVAEGFSGILAAGTQYIPLSLDLERGSYLVIARSDFGTATRMIEGGR